MKIVVTTIMVTLFLISQHYQAWSTDTFPLDLWEEMTSWERSSIKSHDPNVEAQNEPDSRQFQNAGMAPLTFPFDVQKELDDLNGTDWKRLDSDRYRHQATDLSKKNTYWLP